MSEARSQPDASEKLVNFTDLWLVNQHVVAAFVRLQVRDYHISEDIVQEVARNATTHFDRYDPTRPFSAWLIGIAKQRIAEHYRRQSRKPIVFSSEVVELFAESFTEAQPETDERLATLRECVERLSDRHRRMLALRYAQRMSSAEIASEVGGRQNAIDVLFHRIRKALVECVRQRFSGGLS